MSAPFTCRQARQAIAAIVREASGAPAEKVYSFNCLNFKTDPKTGIPDLSDWVSLFTSGVEGEVIHGWVVRRVAREGEPREGWEDFWWTYEVIGCYRFDSDGTETANSDDEFSEIVDRVAEAFNVKHSPLSINGKSVEHEGLKFPALTVIQAGEKLLHFAGGRITIFHEGY